MNLLTKSKCLCVFGSILAVIVEGGAIESVTAATYYFHNDRLGTPQVVTDEYRTVEWRGEYDPFGELAETVLSVEQNPRLPGQYHDDETGYTTIIFGRMILRLEGI